MSYAVIHEQRVNLKFLVKLGKKGSEALRMLQTVYGKNTMVKSCFYQWYNRFKQGREDVTDEKRSGRPVSAYTAENIKAVEQAVNTHKDPSIRKVSAIINVSKETVRRIMNNELKIKFSKPIRKDTTSPRHRRKKHAESPPGNLLNKGEDDSSGRFVDDFISKLVQPAENTNNRTANSYNFQYEKHIEVENTNNRTANSYNFQYEKQTAKSTLCIK